MRALRAAFRARFLALLQYRAAALAGIGTQVFWGLLRVTVLAAFYGAGAAAAGAAVPARPSAPPLSLEEIVTYVWLGQATLLLIIWRTDPEVDLLVRSGNVAYELLRPVDLYALWFARSLANRAAPTLLRCGPLLVLAAAFFGLGPPASPLALVAALAAILLALLLSAAIGVLLWVSLLWTVSGKGFSLLWTAGAWTLSGIVLPLPLFPDWAQPLLSVLPFRALMDAPFRLYLGHLPLAEAPAALAHAAVWVLLMVVLGRALLARGTRRLVVQGG